MISHCVIHMKVSYVCHLVILTKARIHVYQRFVSITWIPAFAGMTQQKYLLASFSFITIMDI